MTVGWYGLILGVVIWVLQRMPLGDWTPWRRQHVGPVSQLGTGGVVAQHHFADGLGRADTVVIHHRHDQVHFLQYE